VTFYLDWKLTRELSPPPAGRYEKEEARILIRGGSGVCGVLVLESQPCGGKEENWESIGVLQTHRRIGFRVPEAEDRVERAGFFSIPVKSLLFRRLGQFFVEQGSELWRLAGETRQIFKKKKEKTSRYGIMWGRYNRLRRTKGGNGIVQFSCS